MLKVLLKKQMTEIFRAYFVQTKQNKARTKVSTIVCFTLFAFLMIVILGGIFTAVSVSLCIPMSEAGVPWLYYAIMGLIAVMLGTFGSVFSTYSSLYLSKDNDLLLSMPIPVDTIIASRLLGVYLIGLMYTGVVIVPAIVVYWALASFTAASVIGGIFWLFSLSVFVLVLSCALGYAVARISVKLKRKSFTAVLAALLFFGAYYLFFFNAQNILSELAENAAQLGEQVRSTAYAVYFIGNAGTGNFLSLLVVTLGVLALFFAIWVILRSSFFRIAASSGVSGRVKEKKGRAGKPAKSKGVFSALVAKEFRRFASSANYILNCGFGALILIALGVFVLMGKDLFASLGDVPYGSIGVCMGICLAICGVCTVVPSVSLEGKTLWIIRSLPVDTWAVLRAKLTVQFVLAFVPTVFALICAAIASVFTSVGGIFAAIEVFSFLWLYDLFGLFLGLKLPDLSWTNEITAIKRSACVGLCLLGGGVYSVIGFASVLFLGMAGIATELCMGVLAFITLVAAVFLRRYLKKKGCGLFEEL